MIMSADVAGGFSGAVVCCVAAGAGTVQLPMSPRLQHKVHMPNSADKLADTGKVSGRVGGCRRSSCG
jgi:hypothetical protein